MNTPWLGFGLAACVLYGFYKLLGPGKLSLKPAKKRSAPRKRRTVTIDPLHAKERKLRAELQYVRAQIKHRETM